MNLEFETTQVGRTGKFRVVVRRLDTGKEVLSGPPRKSPRAAALGAVNELARRVLDAQAALDVRRPPASFSWEPVRHADTGDYYVQARCLDTGDIVLTGPRAPSPQTATWAAVCCLAQKLLDARELLAGREVA